jgi:hypothetical protein
MEILTLVAAQESTEEGAFFPCFVASSQSKYLAANNLPLGYYLLSGTNHPHPAENSNFHLTGSKFGLL